jgi:hypothetical protein
MRRTWHLTCPRKSGKKKVMRRRIASISRPYYPRCSIYRSLENRARGLRQASALGFYFTVDYEEPPGGRLKTVSIRDLDSIYFENPHGDSARERLDLILEARQGDPQTRERLCKTIEEERIRHAGFDPGRLDLGEFSQYLVPSTSTGTYTAEEVGNKGYNLLRLIRLGYPVPSFCLINTRMKKVAQITRLSIMDKALGILE